MRVSELAKELGKTSKDVLDVLQKNNQDVASHSSNVSDAQVGMVKKALGAGASEQPKAEGTAPKKKLAAVYRPQNSQQRPAQPKPAARPQTQAASSAPVQQAASAAKPAETVQQARPSQTTDSRQGGFNRDNNRQGGYNRDNNRQGGFNGNREGGFNRDNNRQGGYNRDNNRQGGFNRDNNRQGGFGGNREGGMNRDNNRQGGFGGNREGGFNRDNNRQGGFGGNREGGFNRDNNRQGGFNGNRDNRQGGFGGNREGGFNRDNNRQGGFNGNRDNRQGGFGGNREGGFNRDNNRQGGFNGNRDNRQGGFGGSRDNRQGGSFGANRQGGAGRPGQRDGGAKNYDSPIQTKPTNNRQQTNSAHKKDKYDKTRMMEDGPKNKNGKVSKHPFIMPQKVAEEKVEDTVKVITIPDVLTIKELADKMKLQPSAIVKKLFLQGKIVTLNSEIDFEQAEEIAMEYEVLCEKEEKVDVIAELLKEDEENEDDMVSRPPVVCVMGHVDHGKTSLLDAIRQTNVTSREAGGITQHIGAYTVDIRGQQITFLDTPGHEAFTAMRMRGAQSTDIAILVVAADDGVMPQTIEAINHAKAAEVDIIVAINKIDKPSANIDRVKQELAEYELIPEDWGGSTVFVPVSAHTKEGIQELLEMILLTAEVKELKANPNRRARGLVIEAELDKGKGPVATILVQKGTLRVGDNVTAGPCYGKVRAMMDDKGRRVKEAGPSMPVEILGLNDVPGAGDVLLVTENEKEARSYAETFISESKNKLLEETKSKLSLDDLFSQIKAGNVKELPIIVKADVQGSVEAVKQSLVKLSNEEVVVKVIHGGVGAINESDVTLASASNAIIIGFNVRPDATAKSVADREKVDMRLYRVIYQAIEDVEAAMKGMLDPVFEEQVIGHAVVRQTFKASGVGTIAGAYVMDGKFQRGCSCRITRDGEQIFEGALASLRRFKDDVKEVATGYECGLVFEKFNDLQEDDMVEAYMMVEVPR